MNSTEKLIDACYNGNIVQIKNLISSGINPDVKGENWNPLHAAIENMQIEVVKYLLNIGADPNVKVSGMTPLHHALDIEIDFATQNSENENPKPIITEILINAGANLNKTDDYGRTPIEMAKERNHREAVNLLENKNP